tara:strand:+ start:2363 stop:2827 length:465 start_codon:yes stop_codon:yes gene_type:complete
MLYTVGCSGKPGINDRTTFIELGYQFTEAGGTLVVCKNNTLSEWFEQGIVQHEGEPKIKRDTRPVSTDFDDRIKAALPGINDYPDHWQTYADDYRVAYQTLSHGVDVVYGWFDPDQFSPLLDLASGMGIRAVNFFLPETLRQAQDWSMDKALKF